MISTEIDKPLTESALAPAGARPIPSSNDQADVESEKIRLLCLQARRASLTLLPVLAALAYVLTDGRAASWPWIWAALVWIIFLLRTRVANDFLKRNGPPQQAAPVARRITLMTVAAGLLSGLGMLAMFGGITGDARAVATVLCTGWLAGAAGASGSYARMFPPYAAAFGLPLTVAWWLNGGEHGHLVAIMLILFLAFLVLSVRDVDRVTEQSIRIRFANDALIRELEAQSRKLEDAIQSKSRFLAAASHDLRQPLAALNLFHGLLLRERNIDAATDLAQKFAAPLHALDAILNSLLELSRLDAGLFKLERERVALHVLAEQFKSEFAHKAESKQLAFRVECSLDDVWIDLHVTGRIARNLLENAFKFTERGEVTLSLHKAGPNLEIRVADTGPGIPAADADRVFEEYYQINNPNRAHDHGLGLGLAIVRRLVTLAGGSIALETVPGGGARFVALLPCEALQEEATPVPEAAGRNAATGPLQLMIVEDDPGVQEALHTWASHAGHKVALAGDAHDALKGDAAPDVLITDYRLPGALNGLDLVAAVRTRWPGTPAILISGEADPGLADLSERQDVLFLRKPLSIEALEASVRRCVAS